MIAAAWGTRRGERFRLGYVAGLVHYLSLLYWLLLSAYRWLGIPFGPGLGWLARSAFLALFPAVWVELVTPRTGRVQQDATGEAREVLTQGVGGVLPRNWILRLGWACSGAAVWVGWEMLLARVLGGFPWALL